MLAKNRGSFFSLINHIRQQGSGVTIQVPFSRRLRRPLKKKGILRSQEVPQTSLLRAPARAHRPPDGVCVPLHPLLNSYVGSENEVNFYVSHKDGVLHICAESHMPPIPGGKAVTCTCAGFAPANSI